MTVVKKFAVCVLCFAFFFVCCFFGEEEGRDAVPVLVGVESIRTIIIDAGHGGFDGGAVATDGTPEKDINLLIATEVAEILRLHGFNVIMTRRDDTATDTDPTATISERKKSDMRERLRIMEENPEALFVSVHLNKFTTSSAWGAQVFYSPNNVLSKELGLSIQKTLHELVQPDNTRTVKQATSSTYLLYKTKIPACIVECGFLSNAEELKLLKEPDYRSQIAFAIFCGITEFSNNSQEM